MYIWRNERVRVVLVTRTDFILIASKILEKVVKNDKFITKERAKSLEISSAYLNFCKNNLNGAKLAKKSNKEIANIYRELCKFHEEFSFYNVPLWFVLGDVFSDYLKKNLRSYSKNIDRDFEILSQPTIPTYLYKYSGLLFQLRKKLQSKENTDKLIQILERNFSWIPFDYVGPDLWTKKDFIRQAPEVIEQPQRPTTIKKQQIRLADSLKLATHLRRLFKDFQMSQAASDEKKEFLTKAQVYWQKALIPEISKRTNIPPKLLRFLTESEINEALVKKRTPSKLNDRPRRSVFIKRDQSMDIVYGDTVNRLYKKYNPIGSRLGNSL